MKYMGSKNRIKKDIINILEKNMLDTYIEPFVGGCNVIDSISHNNKIGMDCNKYLISMWKALQSGWNPPIEISKEYYDCIKDNKDEFPMELVAVAGFCATYNAKWFGGYANITKTKNGNIRNYYDESIRNIMKQVDNIKDVLFLCNSYSSLRNVHDCTIYCDPPYKGTTKYKDDFNHDEFYEWVRDKSSSNIIFISEYDMPDDFICIWSKELTTTLDKNSRQQSIEKLFVHNSIINKINY